MRRRERRRHFGLDCTTRGEELGRLGDEPGRGEHERATQEGDRDNGQDECSSRAHRASEDQTGKIGEPRPTIMSTLAFRDRGEDDALIQVRRRLRDRERRQQADDSRHATQFRCAGGAASNVARQSPPVRVGQLTKEIGVDEWACALAIQSGTIR